jgi:hypothetical protein
VVFYSNKKAIYGQDGVVILLQAQVVSVDASFGHFYLPTSLDERESLSYQSLLSLDIALETV